MSASLASPRTVGGWCVVILALTFIGCNPQSGLPPLFPDRALPPGVDSDAATFRNNQLARGFRPRANPIVRSRPGRCFAGGCSVDVRITVLDGAALPDHDSPPSSGYPIAILRNLDGNHKEAKYQLDEATDDAEYWIWIDALGANQTRWTLLRIPQTGRVRAKFEDELTPCHLGPAGLPVEVDFAEFKHQVGDPGERCRITTKSNESAASYASAISFGAIRSFITKIAHLIDGRAIASAPIWIECNSGCCT